MVLRAEPDDVLRIPVIMIVVEVVPVVAYFLGRSAAHTAPLQGTELKEPDSCASLAWDFAHFEEHFTMLRTQKRPSKHEVRTDFP